jgi:branched-chain amino acid transport system substrate-binding protein
VKKTKRTLPLAVGLCLMCTFMFLLAGCGGTSGNGDQQSQDSNIIKIVTVSPLSGTQAPFGEAVKMGVQFAVEEKVAEIEKLGFKVEFLPQDDAADPKVGVAVAQKLITDPEVLAVAGHMNSGVTIPASEIYAKANLAMYTSFATNPTITERGLKNVGRICNRDDVQGSAAAKFAVETLQAKSAFVVHDKTAYGQGVADEFKRKAESLGVKTVGYEGLTQGEVDFSAIVNKVVLAKPDVLYYGGNYTEAGCLLKQMREKGNEAVFIGSDGEDSPEWVKVTGKYIVGAYYTTMASDISATPEGKAWAERFNQRFGKMPEAISTYSYDTGLVIMQGLLEAINANDGKMPTREQVSEAIREVEVQGITGTIAFDEKGDNKNAKSFVMEFKEEKYPGVLASEVTK